MFVAEVISTTKSSCDISNSKELQVSSANSIKEGVKPANHANLVLSTAVTEAGKDGNMDVEKREPVLSLQEERLKYVQPVRERVYKLLPRDIQFCVHMIEKYGENYEGMAKDEGNIYHDSAKGIAQKIRIFKRSPEYAVYLKQQAEQKDSVA
ncbi:unnamed protein product [Thelazia callipaeda]|uniref:Nucleolar protein 16 n=1 Tax=Thelazia callipaeda TaxID=103827 RepID=A0A0N5CU35_THECL|nr:unnamed protein product [Thelazia callipaeda]